MKSVHIVYRDGEDGLTSAAIIYEFTKRYNKEHGLPKCNIFFYRVTCDDKLKDIIHTNAVIGDKVYFVDYSFEKCYKDDYNGNFKHLKDLINAGIDITIIAECDDTRTYTTEFFDKKNLSYFISDIYESTSHLAYIYAYNILNIFNYDSPAVENIIVPTYIPEYIRRMHDTTVTSTDTKYDNFLVGLKAAYHTPKNLFSIIFKCNSRNLGMLFDPNSKELVSKHMRNYISTIETTGETIIDYLKNEDKEYNSIGYKYMIRDSSNQQYKEYKCFVVNRRCGVESFGKKIDEYDICIAYYYDGYMYVVDMYTNKWSVNCKALVNKILSRDRILYQTHDHVRYRAKQHIFIKDKELRIQNKLFSNAYRNTVM